jgi:hypothetical protein
MDEIVDRIPTISYDDLPLDALHSASQKVQSLITPTTQQFANMPFFMLILNRQITRLLAMREQKKSYSVHQYNASEWAPVVGEEDFRDISVFPTTEEIFSVARGEISKKVRPNIVEGKYKNVMHYLDTHFRLLRYTPKYPQLTTYSEDCLQPLREGIRTFLETKDQSSTRDIRVYRDVRMKAMQCSRSGIVYRVSFQVDAEVSWERSKRLIYGSLLCLSSDDFKTLLWATVSNRDTALLTQRWVREK